MAVSVSKSGWRLTARWWTRQFRFQLEILKSQKRVVQPSWAGKTKCLITLPRTSWRWRRQCGKVILKILRGGTTRFVTTRSRPWSILKFSGGSVGIPQEFGVPRLRLVVTKLLFLIPRFRPTRTRWRRLRTYVNLLTRLPSGVRVTRQLIMRTRLPRWCRRVRCRFMPRWTRTLLPIILPWRQTLTPTSMVFVKR